MVDSAIVIVGAGHGGVQLACSLREAGHAGTIHLIDNEGTLPYQRPPLSKSFLTGQISADELSLRGSTYYQDNQIELHRGDACTRVDRIARTATLASGIALRYDHLVMATGARPRLLSGGLGADFCNVLALRTLGDAVTIRTILSSGRRDVVVVGGGFIGLELAAVAASTGHQVTVVEALDRPMSRAVSPELSTYTAAVHRQSGTNFIFGTSVVGLHGSSGNVRSVELDNGEHLKADLVVVGIGVVPNVELAYDAGLEVDNGIVVNHQLLSSDSRISALGDCAAYPCAYATGHVRLESIQNAVCQAQFIARRLTGRVDDAYDDVPWFWTEQYNLKIQIAGLYGANETRIVLGDQSAGAFSILHFDDDLLTCVESVNRTSDHMAARRLLSGDRRPRPTAAGQPGFDLKSFARSAASVRRPQPRRDPGC